jgi:hypothetical protein
MPLELLRVERLDSAAHGDGLMDICCGDLAA